jgi:hypothetical protein
MLTGPLEPLPPPFPRTPSVETRVAMPMELVRGALLAMAGAPLVEIALRFPNGVAGQCPVCCEPTSGVVSVGVQLVAANIAQPYRGPVDIVLEGGRPRSYRLEPCGCQLEVR